MDNRNNIKVERIHQRFNDYKEMDKEFSFEGIENLRSKALDITSVLTCMDYTWWIIMSLTNLLTVLTILIAVLYFCIILLSWSIITDIIIPDKLKEIYEKAYFVHGMIWIAPSLMEEINQVFIYPEEIDDFLASLMSGVLLKKQKCFKCQIGINYVDYFSNNISTTPIRQLEKIWKSPHIQLYCCSCYKKKSLFKKRK